jgi:hypothetical protein
MVKTNNKGGLQVNEPIDWKAKCEAADSLAKHWEQWSNDLGKNLNVARERAEAAEKALENMTALHNGSEKSVLAWKNEVELEQSKRVQAEKACAEMRDILAVFDGAGVTFEHCMQIKRVLNNGVGHTYISLTDPLIVELVDALSAHSNSMLRFDAIAAYEARKKEAGL